MTSMGKVFVGAGVVGAVVGAGYLLVRYMRRRKAEATEDPTRKRDLAKLAQQQLEAGEQRYRDLGLVRREGYASQPYICHLKLMHYKGRLAAVMGEQIREMDLLARYGGEEFALLASQTPLEGGVALAEKIRVAINQTQVSLAEGAEPVRNSVSAGAAAFRGDEEALFEDADAALYRAKAFGKDCVVAA